MKLVLSFCVMLGALWPARALGSVVIHDQSGIVAQSHLCTILDSQGRVWQFTFNSPGDWIRRADWDPPLPVDQLLFWDQNSFVTTENHMFYAVNDLPGNWYDAGPWPLSAAPEGKPDVGAPASLAIPNPASGTCRISFHARTPGPVSVQVFDASGRRVRDLLSGTLPAGEYSPMWDGKDDAESTVPAGTYFTRIETAEGVTNGKVTLVK